MIDNDKRSFERETNPQYKAEQRRLYEADLGDAITYATQYQAQQPEVRRQLEIWQSFQNDLNRQPTEGAH